MSRQTKKDNKINNRELIPDDAIKDTEDSQGFEVDWELVEKKYRQKYMRNLIIIIRKAGIRVITIPYPLIAILKKRKEKYQRKKRS